MVIGFSRERVDTEAGQTITAGIPAISAASIDESEYEIGEDKAGSNQKQ